MNSDAENQHAFRTFLSMSHPNPVHKNTVYGEGDYAIWNIQKNGDGECEWIVKEQLSLREKHSWKIQNLSSERANPDAVRILLFGGSAAAGFGYWGDFSLAQAIEYALNSKGTTTYEVIDLACVNALWDQCIETFKHSLSLRPDKVIFFTGNNEAKTLLRRLRARQLSHLPSASAALFYETIPQKEVISTLNACYEEHMVHEAERTIALAKEANVEVSFVIPEFNLRDWKGPEKIPFFMGGAKLNEWWKVVNDAETCLKNQEYKKAIDLFNKASELDYGSCQRSVFGMASVWHAMGNYAKAKPLFEKARDTGLAPFVRGNPQVTERVRKALQEVYIQHKVPYIDLKRLLDTREMACGREYFIDYCHLNVTGIQLLSGAISSQIMKQEAEQSILMNGNGSYDRSTKTSYIGFSAHPETLAGLSISPQENGLGSWVAAIHNYHHGQSKEIVKYWLEDAIKKYPKLDQIYRFLYDYLCDPWRDRFSIGWFKKHGFFDLLGEKQFFFFAKFFYHARFDFELVKIIDEICNYSGTSKGIINKASLRGILEDLKGEMYSLFFMDMRKGFQSGERTAPRSGWERRCLDMDANLPVARISFPAPDFADSMLMLKISGVAFDTQDSMEKHCVIFLNDQKISQVQLQPETQKIEIPISRDNFISGINTLEFHWSHLASLYDLTESHLQVDCYEKYGLYPVAARIHSITITPNTITS